MPVGHSPAVDDVATGLRIELPAEPARMRVQGPGPPHRAKSPDVAQELLLCEAAVRVGREGAQQRELLVLFPPLTRGVGLY
jgi:hypothetical protein